MKKLTKDQIELLNEKGFQYSDLTFSNQINQCKIITDVKDLKPGTYVATLHLVDDLGDKKLKCDMENKGFLTLEEAEEQADYCYEYQEGVYEYKIIGKGWTLIEHGEVLAEGATWVDWREKGVYKYEIEGEGRTLVEHGEILVEGADLVSWFEKGVYHYEIEGEGCTLVEDGEVLVEGVYWVIWFAKGVYKYGMKGKGSTLVEDGKVLIEGASSAWWYAKGVYEYRIEGGKLVKINKNK